MGSKPDVINIPLLDRVRRAIPFFKDFGFKELRAVLRSCQRVSYPAGMHIIRQGEISDNMYIVIQGEVEVSRRQGDEKEILCTLQAGECFGEMGIIEKTRRSATVTAKSDCLLLAVSRSLLEKVNPVFISRLYRNISSILSERLRKTSDVVEDLQAERDELRRLMESLEVQIQEYDSKGEEVGAPPNPESEGKQAHRKN